MRTKEIIATRRISRGWLLAAAMVGLVYFSWWWWPNNSKSVLFFLLLIGEIYHLFLALTFWYTLWPEDKRSMPPKLKGFSPSVDIMVTMVGEPAEVVEKTLRAAMAQDYDNFKVYLLNDGKGAGKPNWRDGDKVAKKVGAKAITRERNTGAKAGNVNNALRQTEGEIVVVLDTDMAPKREFLKKIIPYFKDEKVGFVQSPQYYTNWEKNEVSRGAWEQQEFFFGPIMKGKDRSNAAFICGTNFAIRRKALVEAGGMQEDNIAEDFLTSIYVHARGWKSVYTTEILCKGLAPEDLLSYIKQQTRWARGSLEALIRHNPLGQRGLSGGQKIQYLASAAYYLNGLIVLIDIVMPLLFFYLGWEPVGESSVTFAIFFLPFMFISLYLLNLASMGKLSLRGVSFSQSCWVVQLRALVSILLNKKMGFAVTSKKKLEGNFLYLAYPHLAYIGLSIIGALIAINREGVNSSVATNIAWATFNGIMFVPFIGAAYDWAGLRQRLDSGVRVNKVEVETG